MNVLIVFFCLFVLWTSDLSADSLCLCDDSCGEFHMGLSSGY